MVFLCYASNRFGAFLLFSSSSSSWITFRRWLVTSTYLLWFGIILHMSCMLTNKHIFLLNVNVCVICMWTTEWEEFDVLWHSRILSVRLLSAFALLRANEQKNSDYKWIIETVLVRESISEFQRAFCPCTGTSHRTSIHREFRTIPQWTDTFLWSRKHGKNYTDCYWKFTSKHC